MNINLIDEMVLIKYFETLPQHDAENILAKLSDKKLERVYIEAVDYQNQYTHSFLLIDNELIRRKSESIEKSDSEHVSTLEQNAVETEKKNV